MIEVKPKDVLILAAGLVVAFLIFRGKAGAVTTAVSKAAVDAAGGAVAGTAIGVGSQLGLPDTSNPDVVAQGQADMAAGNYLKASTELPAGQFVSGLWSAMWGTNSTPATAGPSQP